MSTIAPTARELRTIVVPKEALSDGALEVLVFGDLTGPDLGQQAKLDRLIRHNAPNVCRRLHNDQPGKALSAAAQVIRLYKLAAECDLTDDESDALRQRLLTTAVLLDYMSGLPRGKQTPKKWYDKRIARATKLCRRIQALIDVRPEELTEMALRVNIDPGLMLAKP